MMWATRAKGSGYVQLWSGPKPPVFNPIRGLFVADKHYAATVIEACFPLRMFKNPPPQEICVPVGSIELHAAPRER